tara:strand:+ start:351 stop:512 length:162 start_codon:yes stop_codon:yes gene_type:complete
MTIKNLYPKSDNPYYAATCKFKGVVYAAFSTSRAAAMGNCYLLTITAGLRDAD